MRAILRVALAVFIMPATHAGAACQFVVDAAGGGTHTTIQAAVDALPPAGPCRVDVRAGTYQESVTIAGRNASAAGDEARVLIAGGRGAILAAAGEHAIAISGTRWLTIEGLTIAGAQGAAVAVDSSSDIAIARNDIHNNGAGPRGGGVLVGRRSDRVWIVNNLIRSNGRNGVDILGGDGGPAYVVNNTILWNGWNGVRLARDADAYVINNLLVGNGTDGGTVGGRWGLMSDGSPPAATVLNNVFYRNGARAPSASGGDLADVGQAAGATVAGNFTTSGGEGRGVAACVISACAGAPASTFFPGTGFGPDFHLTAASPAAARGLGSFVHHGRDWVPDTDADGEPRDRRGGVDVGWDQRKPVP